MGRNTPAHTRLALLMHYNFPEGVSVKDLALLLLTPTSPAHTHFCIPNLDASTQIPPYWGLGGGTALLSLSTFLLLTLPPLCLALAHGSIKRPEPFVPGSLTVR